MKELQSDRTNAPALTGKAQSPGGIRMEGLIAGCILAVCCSGAAADDAAREQVKVIGSEPATTSYQWQVAGKAPVYCNGGCARFYAPFGTDTPAGAVVRLLRADSSIVIAQCKASASGTPATEAKNAGAGQPPQQCTIPDANTTVPAEFSPTEVKLTMAATGIPGAVSTATYAILGVLKPAPTSQPEVPTARPQGSSNLQSSPDLLTFLNHELIDPRPPSTNHAPPVQVLPLPRPASQAGEPTPPGQNSDPSKAQVFPAAKLPPGNAQITAAGQANPDKAKVYPVPRSPGSDGSDHSKPPAPKGYVVVNLDTGTITPLGQMVPGTGPASDPNSSANNPLLLKANRRIADTDFPMQELAAQWDMYEHQCPEPSTDAACLDAKSKIIQGLQKVFQSRISLVDQKIAVLEAGQQDTFAIDEEKDTKDTREKMKIALDHFPAVVAHLNKTVADLRRAPREP